MSKVFNRQTQIHIHTRTLVIAKFPTTNETHSMDDGCKDKNKVKLKKVKATATKPSASNYIAVQMIST